MMEKHDKEEGPKERDAGFGIFSQKFWEKQALKYKHPFDTKFLSYTNQIIDKLEANNIPIKDSRILDIGSGPGTFALPLASRGATVTALDISHQMLERLQLEALARDITSVSTIRASWQDFNPSAAYFQHSFDTVLSSLSVAIETVDDLLKMEQCARQWCVCIAAGKIKRSFIYESVLSDLGASLEPKPDIRKICKLLMEMGRSFSFHALPIFLNRKKPLTELADDVLRSLEAQGNSLDKAAVSAHIASLINRSQLCFDKSEYNWQCTWGMVIWPSGQGKRDENR